MLPGSRSHWRTLPATSCSISPAGMRSPVELSADLRDQRWGRSRRYISLIPAGEIEQLVAGRVRQWLLDPAASTRRPRHGSRNRQLSSGWSRELRSSGGSGPSCRGRGTRAVLTALIERSKVRVDQVAIHLRPMRLAAIFDISVARRRASLTRKPSPCPCRHGCAEQGGRSGC